jgi:hypothetical protein
MFIPILVGYLSSILACFYKSEFEASPISRIGWNRRLNQGGPNYGTRLDPPDPKSIMALRVIRIKPTAKFQSHLKIETRSRF